MLRRQICAAYSDTVIPELQFLLVPLELPPLGYKNPSRYFLAFNKEDDADRVRDILTALAWLKNQTPDNIELRGTGNAALWCLFAAATAGMDLTLKADIGGLSGTDDEFLRQFFVPAIQRAGGLD